MTERDKSDKQESNQIQCSSNLGVEVIQILNLYIWDLSRQLMSFSKI